MSTLSLFAPGAVEPHATEGDRDTWATPIALAGPLVTEYRCTLDVAASAKNAKCAKFYTSGDDGVSQPWPRSEIIWCNPPYSDPSPWVKKAIAYAESGGFRAVLLLPAMLGVSWFTSLTMHAEWWTFDKRIQFDPPLGVKPSSSNIGNVLAVFGYGYQARWRGIRSAADGAIILDTANAPQRQRSR